MIVSKGQMVSLAGALLGVVGTNFAGRAIFTGLLKMISGAGSIVGGAIGAGTAVTLTFALGRTYVYIMEAVEKNIVSLDNLDMNLIGKIMKSYIENATDCIKQTATSGNFDMDAFERVSREQIHDYSSSDTDNNISIETPLQNTFYDSEKKDNVSKKGILEGVFSFFSKKK